MKQPESMNNKGLRDPIWTFVGVIVAIIGVGVSVYALFPQVLHPSPPSPLPTSLTTGTPQKPEIAANTYPFLAASYRGSFVDTSVSPAQSYAFSLYSVTEQPPIWSSQAALGGIISNATEETNASGSIEQNGLVTFTIPVSQFHLQNEQFVFTGKRSSTGTLSGTWHSSGDSYGTASGSWNLQP